MNKLLKIYLMVGAGSIAFAGTYLAANEAIHYIYEPSKGHDLNHPFLAEFVSTCIAGSVAVNVGLKTSYIVAKALFK